MEEKVVFAFLAPDSPESMAIDKVLQKKDFKTRANRSVKGVIEDLTKELELGEMTEDTEQSEESEESEDDEHYKDVVIRLESYGIEHVAQKQRSKVRKRKPVNFGRKLKKATQRGANVAKKAFFPSMPHVLQDLWVFTELAVTIAAFVLSCLEFNVGKVQTPNDKYTLAAFVLSTVNLILALIDWFLYFFQAGSCASCVNKLIKKAIGLCKKKEKAEEAGEEEDDRCCKLLSRKTIERLNNWFELSRNILSELLIYPLLMCDLIGFIYFRGYSRQNLSQTSGRNDFSLFIIGQLYLVIAVYIMRTFMIVTTLFILNRMPVDFSGSRKDYISLIMNFGIHAIFQIVIHFTIIIAISFKMDHEFMHGSDVQFSPFLWYMIVSGWFLPLVGIAAFFLVNYYWVQEFSVAFFIDMMSMLQGEGFAEVVFGGEGVEASKEKAMDFVDKIQLVDSKNQFNDLKKNKDNTFSTKILFPLKMPVVAGMAFLYDILFLSFIACFFLEFENGQLVFILFESEESNIIFLVIAVVLLVCNIQMLLVINLWLVITLLSFVLFLISIPWAAFVVVICTPFSRFNCARKLLRYHKRILRALRCRACRKCRNRNKTHQKTS